MADDVFIGGKQLPNPNGIQVVDSDNPTTGNGPTVSTGQPSMSQDVVNPYNANDQAQRIQLAERSQPRDINAWSNGQVQEMEDDPDTWSEETANAKGLAQSKLSVIEDGHHVVHTPDGSHIAFPNTMEPEEMHGHVQNWWNRTMDKAINVIGNVVQNTPGAATALEAGQKYYVDPTNKYIEGTGNLAVKANEAMAPTVPENAPDWVKKTTAAEQGVSNSVVRFAAQTVADPRMWPFFAESLAAGTATVGRQVLGRALSGIIGSQMAVSTAKGVQDLYENWDKMSVKERADALTGNTLSAVMAGLTGYHAAVGSPVAAKIDEAKTAPKVEAPKAEPYAGEERRTGPDRTLMSPTDIESAMRNRRLQDIRTPFDTTQGASDTMNRDISKRIPTPAEDTAFFNKKEAEQVKPGVSVSEMSDRPEKKILAIRVDGQRAGQMSLTPMPTLGDGAMEVSTSQLKPEFQGKGHGTESYKQAIDYAKSKGATALYSDDQVSADADRVWQSLQDKGIATEDAATGRYKIDLRTAGSAADAAKDTDFFTRAKNTLGPTASISDIALEAQRLKEKAQNPIASGADAFNAEQGRPPVEHKEVAPSPHAKVIADEYNKLQHNPSDPAVRNSYASMKQDIDDQWEHATDKMGIKMEPWTEEGQPYKNSKEMTADVKNNKHLYFFQGGDMPEDHPLAQTDSRTGLTYNDKLRAVHDLFGHAANDNQFGPAGEERAWQEHRQMFSSDSVPALTTETRGQNSWTNFGDHLRNEEGNIPKKGESGYLAPADRPYAQNKAALLPEWAHQPEGSPIPDAVAVLHNEGGGSTYNPAQGDMNGKDAFAVPAHPELSKIVDGEKVTPADTKAYMDQPEVAAALKADPNLSVGTWAHEGKTYYDLSVTIPDRDEAIALGKRNNQIAIRDLKNGEDISTGGTGTPASEEKPVTAKDLWTDESGTYTSGKFMKFLAKNKMLSKEGQMTLGDAAEEDVVPGWSEVSKYLTPEDRAQASTAIRKNVVKLVNDFNPEWVAEAAKAGSVAKGWYQRATSLIQHMMGEDSNRFTDFIASLSPQKGVEQNLTDALNFYNLWVSAGKPLGVENEKVIRDLTERAETGRSGQVARNQLYNNLVNDAPPSGPKVSNFARNLKGEMNEVTKDRWVAYMFGNNDRMFRWFKAGEPKPAVHLAADALIRAVGQTVGMLPAEVQETAWSFLRTVVNLSEKEKISPKEAVSRLREPDIKEGGSELTNLIANSTKVQSALNQLATATGDERFRPSTLTDTPEFKRLLAEHRQQAPIAGGLGGADKRVLAKGVKEAIQARSSLTDAKNAKDVPEPKAKPKKALKDKATDFNPNNLSSNFQQRLSNRLVKQLA